MKVILKTVLVAGLTMLLGAGVCGCGKKDAEKTDQSKPTLDQSTPETVAKTWWQAVVDEDFKTMEALSTPALAKELTDEIKAKIKKDFARYKGKEIAADRFSSVHTINSHRKNIFRKLGVNCVHDAIKYALRAGLVDESEFFI